MTRRRRRGHTTRNHILIIIRRIRRTWTRRRHTTHTNTQQQHQHHRNNYTKRRRSHIRRRRHVRTRHSRRFSNAPESCTRQTRPGELSALPTLRRRVCRGERVLSGFCGGAGNVRRPGHRAGIVRGVANHSGSDVSRGREVDGVTKMDLVLTVERGGPAALSALDLTAVLTRHRGEDHMEQRSYSVQC